MLAIVLHAANFMFERKKAMSAIYKDIQASDRTVIIDDI